MTAQENAESGDDGAKEAHNDGGGKMTAQEIAEMEEIEREEAAAKEAYERDFFADKGY